MSTGTPPLVLILGAGVNGACAARELALNGVNVWIVDKFDIAYGATSRSSRLIHGGLRYLEYGDVDLVRESLTERARLLKLAPQYVRPLRLFIPVKRRFGGLLAAGLRYLKLNRTSWGAAAAKRLAGTHGRGLLTVRLGLWRYDRLAGKRDLPGHTVLRVGDRGPRVDSAYHWLCGYSDAQMPWPERFTLALLDDARTAAAERTTELRVFTHHTARFEEGGITIRPTCDETNPSSSTQGEQFRISPDSIINATGAWGDRTLRDLPVDSPPLFGGTKGSHLITRQPAIVQALGGDAVYAEADDGRLVFIIPWEDAVLIGTTDERFEGPPEQAVATDREIDYLIEMVNEVFPQVHLKKEQIESHYCGVRPLPAVSSGTTGAIPRGHWIDSTVSEGFPIDTLIGGKLTTCRALGEEVADRVLQRLGIKRTASTRERPVPGSKGLDQNPELQSAFWENAAAQTNFPPETIKACGRLLGSRAVAALSELSTPDDRALVTGTPYPRGFVRQILQTEWVHRLEDLVERRLMLTESPSLNRNTLAELAERLSPGAATNDKTVRDLEQRLRTTYGVQVRDFAEPAAIDRPRESDGGKNSSEAYVAAHPHCRKNIAELNRSEKCGCFYCLRMFPPSEIENWCDGGETALCPHCGVDSIIASASGFELTPQLLEMMHRHAFGEDA